MRDPGRLRDEGDAFERAMLASARGDRMSPDARRALLASFASGVAAGVAGGVKGTALGHGAAKTLGATLGKWMALAAVGGALVAALAVATVARRSSAVPVPSASVPVVPAPVAESVPAAAAEPPVEPSDDRPRAALSSAPRRVVRGTTNVHRPAPSAIAATRDATDESTLAAELKLIEKARAALRVGNASDALSALDDHRARFSPGALAEEADVLRIEARVRAGDTVGATALARGFLASRPKSPYVDRVQSALRAIESKGAR